MVESGNIFVDEQIMALIGQNNTGKSTVLDAIQCVFPESMPDYPPYGEMKHRTISSTTVYK